MSGTTINISGSNNDSNLVLGSSGASIADHNDNNSSLASPDISNAIEDLRYQLLFNHE